VFEVFAAGGEQTLYNFFLDEGYPQGGLILDESGDLYGTTDSGGSADAGTIFEINAAGQETVLYFFSSGAAGALPYAGVIRDGAGNLYGTAAAGGAGWGVVYELSSAGVETVLYSFTGKDGANPATPLLRTSNGHLYGTTQLGGLHGGGVVFEIEP